MPAITEVVARHIHAKWNSIRCPLCEDNNWTMNGPFGLLPATVDARGYVSGYLHRSHSSPVITMVCRNCGHTSLIDYNVMIGKEP